MAAFRTHMLGSVATMRRALVASCGLGAAAAGIVLVTNPTLRRETEQLLDGGLRFLRTSYHATIVAVDYKFTLRGVERGDPEYWELRGPVDERTARRLFRVCKNNGGVYVKLGQYLASMNHVLPPVVTAILSPLQDNASTRSFEEMRVVLEAEMGAEAMTRVFQSFDTTAIASASLAQVHIATTKQGERVAVKIQYPGLRAQVAADMFTIRTLVTILGKLFPQFEYSWMMPEYEDSIALELDFQQEARNSKRVAAMFQHDKDVYVPRVKDHLSTSRVLTMEYIDGVKPTNVAGLASMGVTRSEVASIVSRVFGDMIHVHGFVHCDPHPGNLLVRKLPDATTQLVVLDHGMYRRLDQDFRAAYCRLWKGMMLVDMQLVQQAARDMGVGEFAEVLPLMFVFRPLSSGTSASDVGKRMSKESVAAVKQKFKGTTMQQVKDFMERLPRDLLFVGRSTNLVRSLNKELGGTSQQRFRIMAESATRGVALDRAYDRRAPGTTHPTVSPHHPVAVDDSGKRLDTESVFSRHRINAPTDSEVAALRGPRPWRARMALWWDVSRLRTHLWLLDTVVKARMWWRGTSSAGSAEQDEASRSGHRRHGPMG